MTHTERGFLRSLRDSGDKGIAESRAPKRCAPLLQRLEMAGCVQRQQGVRGAIYVINDHATFARFIEHEAPLGLQAQVMQSASRAEAVLRVGDAKAVPAGDCMGIFVRSFSPGMSVASSRGNVDVTGLTKLAGGAALLLEDGVEWTCSGKMVAVIENAEAFWHYERVLSRIDMAIWTAGRISTKRLLRWLAGSTMQHCQYIHWGDYDPVGVAEYIRLRDACPGRVTTWVPDALESLLPKYGKSSLLLRHGNQRVYTRIRRMIDDPVVARLVRCFDTYHKGLEQEALLGGAIVEPDTSLMTGSPHGS